LRRYYITDGESRVDHIAENLAAGVDMIQIREKNLPARELAALVRRVLELPNPNRTRILVNERTDVALATGAHGVHLPSDAISPGRLRAIVPREFLIGVSTHTLEEVVEAERLGANFVVFGPVFTPISKTSHLPPRGIEELARVCASARIPVFALGGITVANAPLCERAGAVGIAGIAYFMK
jgi:thiamine-phosphate pyrophosphorylase